MIPAEKVTKFSGPPGTGKSTKLLSIVEQLLAKGVDPENIAYTTFTRAGAYEARDRACERFKLPTQRLPYFKTLHALCYELLPRMELMSVTDWCTIGRTLGVFFSEGGTGYNQGFLPETTKGDYMMSLWSLNRVNQEPLEETWKSRDSYSNTWNVNEAEFRHFVQTITNYKREFGKIDYADILERYVESGPDLNVDYVIIDEAQDLSTLQWAVVDKLCKNATEIWVAGDDDQCIHEWNGAKPKLFIELPAKNYEVLPQSYRIPAKVHRLATSIIGKVKHRLVKEYKPREEIGAINRTTDVSQIDMAQGSWLLLARNKLYLRSYIQHCKQRGFLFAGAFAGANNQKILTSIQAWKDVSSGKKINAATAKTMYVFMSQRDRVTRGYKQVLQAVSDREELGYEDLRDKFGLVAGRTLAWGPALDMIPEEEANYLHAVEKKEGLAATPRIRISTIHGAKGQEADHVVLRTDMNLKTFEAYTRLPDNEHRVFYVAVTRARQTLTLLPAVSERAYTI